MHSNALRAMTSKSVSQNCNHLFNETLQSCKQERLGVSNAAMLTRNVWKRQLKANTRWSAMRNLSASSSSDATEDMSLKLSSKQTTLHRASLSGLEELSGVQLVSLLMKLQELSDRDSNSVLMKSMLEWNRNDSLKLVMSE